MPDNNCTPFAVSLMVADKGDKHKFTFGISKGCTDENESTWAILFKLEEKVEDEWKVRVDFRLDINQEAPAKTEKAEEIADKKQLSQPQREFVDGPMYVAALREQNARSNDRLVQHLLDEAISVQKGLEAGENISAESEQFSEEFSNEFFAARRRPGLKELSIMFLDID